MRAYVTVTAIIFGLLTFVHIWRMIAESRQLAHQPEFLVISALSAALCAWGVWVLTDSRRAR